MIFKEEIENILDIPVCDIKVRKELEIIKSELKELKKEVIDFGDEIEETKNEILGNNNSSEIEQIKQQISEIMLIIEELRA